MAKPQPAPNREAAPVRFAVPPATGPASWLITRRQLDEFERFAPLVSGRLLDVGCGRMPHREALADRVEEYWALDHPAGLHLKKDDPLLDQARFVWSDAETLPFPNATFDTALVLEVFEHLPHPWLLWGELSRVLKPGAHLFLSTPFHYQIHEAPRDFYRYTPFAHRALAEDAGFEILWIRPKGGVPSLVLDFASKLVEGVCRKLRLPTGWIGWVQRLAYRLPGMRRETLGAGRFTLGYCVAARRLADDGPDSQAT